ncbi:Common plant regulatory factor 1 [Camellia lanceoleosa]|uniref:Common plant regulatory factor 1 n=1 Tax=Camellia lanceoleosa TaxID=1840588 RepID=A0ACC0IKP2_9ERIC|nr:Common plant regulatory factor 1 [Camellia lanceoleosa]
MGNSEETRPSKSEKSSSPPPDQTNIHVYPDWAAMQAYFGGRVTVSPYFNSAIASGHAPHPYMWGPPQPMMSPYGAPYAAIYAHGGVYAHPGVPLTAAPNAETPTKSSGNTDQSLLKKMKGFDGLAMSIGNGNADGAEGGAKHVHSQSSETEGSSDRSNGNTAGVDQNGRKRSREETPTIDGNGKIESQNSPIPACEVNGKPDKVMGVNVITGNVVGNITAKANAKASPIGVPQPSAAIPNEAWLQNERELKRERRKQSNRESARRSRLRKQAEAEELAIRVDSLTAENMTLKSEINRLTENSEKLKLENTALMAKLKITRVGQTEEVVSTKVDKKRMPISTENLLSRVNNSGSIDRSNEDGEVYENNSNSGSKKLHQLLDASSRADAVAAR